MRVDNQPVHVDKNGITLLYHLHMCIIFLHKIIRNVQDSLAYNEMFCA